MFVSCGFSVGLSYNSVIKFAFYHITLTAGVIPNRALKKRRGGKHKQRRNFLTSTPYHPKREGQTTQEQNRTIGRQIVIDDLNS